MNAIIEPEKGMLPQLEPQKYYGKYAGIVMCNTVDDLELKDRENHLGEIIIQVPGILEDSDSGQQPIEVIAKPCFSPGFFFVPENESHVWVEFIAGDIDNPIWTGSWYPVTNVPKTFDDQDPNELQKIFRTAAGHVIQLDSTEDDEKIVIHHKSETAITIDNDGNVVIEHHGGARLELKDETVVEITSDTINLIGEITLDGDVHVTGNTDVAGTMDIEGDTGITGDLSVGSGPSTTISGNSITGA